ncbi:hypothetical protein AGMMS4952_24100 [Spirochaetia bacterium]|nr:hypothetical protein AGMMS4952_24100 [Spirochaetia bacterium]
MKQIVLSIVVCFMLAGCRSAPIAYTKMVKSDGVVSQVVYYKTDFYRTEVECLLQASNDSSYLGYNYFIVIDRESESGAKVSGVQIGSNALSTTDYYRYRICYIPSLAKQIPDGAEFYQCYD